MYTFRIIIVRRWFLPIDASIKRPMIDFLEIKSLTSCLRHYNFFVGFVVRCNIDWEVSTRFTPFEDQIFISPAYSSNIYWVLTFGSIMVYCIKVRKSLGWIESLLIWRICRLNELTSLRPFEELCSDYFRNDLRRKLWNLIFYNIPLWIGID